MADPVTMAVVVGGMQAVGAIQQGRQANAAAKHNAGLMEQNARQVRLEAAAREDAQRRQARQLAGTQRASIAQSGTGFSGSAADIMEQSATMAELDALTTRYEGETRAQGLLAQAEQTRWEGNQARKASYLQAGTSLLSSYADYTNASATRDYRKAQKAPYGGG